jgi:TPP-dependent 2-oxoacid decarboxylase
MIDNAIYAALTEKKPVYLEIPCNLVKYEVSEPTPLSFSLTKQSDPDSLTAVTESILHHLNVSVKPVLIGGVKLRKANALYEFEQFADRLQAGVAITPDAKSLFPENHPLYVRILKMIVVIVFKYNIVKVLISL